MKKLTLLFLRNGLLACGGGPVVWAIVYLILHATGVAVTVSAQKVAIEVLTITLLAFIAGGIGVVYRAERLPLALAILLHGIVLYVAYLAIYLINGWLESAITPFIVFTACFLGGYALVWGIIYLVTRRNTDKLNARLASLNEDSAVE